MGDQMATSPYMFFMNRNESRYLCRTKPLSGHEVKKLKKMIRRLYQVNMFLDGLPVRRFVESNGVAIQWTGYPVGFLSNWNSEDHFIVNHLKFTIFVHESEGNGMEIVGFEVAPCSVKRDHEAMEKHKMYDKIEPANCLLPLEEYQMIREMENITFTYEVTFERSDIRWNQRWDSYLKMEGERVHWLSIMVSLIVIICFTGIVSAISFNIRRDLALCDAILDKETRAQMKVELSGWKRVAGDVFREPTCSKLLCVMVGEGVKIIGMAVVTIILAALGFMFPGSPGMLLTVMIILYFFFGVVAGYFGVRLWCTIKDGSEGWKSLAWSISYYFPGIVLFIRTVLNFLLWGSHSTGAIQISLYFILLSLWFCISVPLTLLGGFLAARAEPIQFPVRTNQTPHEIPARKCPSWVLILVAGILPFGVLFIEQFFILTSIWLGRFYYLFGFLLIVFLLLIIISAEVSIILTYMHLYAEDWKWWWKSFFASGSLGFYVFLFSTYYLVFDLKSLDGSTSIALYLGYSLIMALAIMLSTGTIGFLASFYFVHKIFSSINID